MMISFGIWAFSAAFQIKKDMHVTNKNSNQQITIAPLVMLCSKYEPLWENLL